MTHVLPRLILIGALLLLLGLLSACSTNSTASAGSTPVLVQRQMQLPPLPDTARQKQSVPSECLPTCLENNSAEQESMLQKLQKLGLPD